jgi:Ca-activated chloride channel family protein
VSFDSPVFLFLFFPLLSLFLIMVLRRKRRRWGVEFLVAAVPQEKRELMKKKLLFRITLSDLFFILFTGFVIFALSGPRWGTELITEARRGMDLVLAFDISQSMKVRDCPPLPGNFEASSRL